MLQSLRDAIDGWRQARTFRRLTEILADTSDSDDVSGCAGLTKEEKLNILEESGTFVESYLARLDANRAFAAGATLYSLLSPRYRCERPSRLARIQYKTEQHIV